MRQGIDRICNRYVSGRAPVTDLERFGAVRLRSVLSKLADWVHRVTTTESNCAGSKTSSNDDEISSQSETGLTVCGQRGKGG